MESVKEINSEIMKSFAKFKELSPEELKEFTDFLKLVEKGKALSVKEKELIALAISVVKQCKWCISFHLANAVKAGATKDEIMEAVWVAVLMGGGPALMYAQYVLKGIEELNL